MWKIISRSWAPIHSLTHAKLSHLTQKLEALQRLLSLKPLSYAGRHIYNLHAATMFEWACVRCARCRIVRIRSIKFNSEKLSTHSTVQLAAASVAAAHMCSTHTSHSSMLSHPCFSVTFAIFGPHCCKFSCCCVGINCWLLFTLWYTTNSYFIGLLLRRMVSITRTFSFRFCSFRGVTIAFARHIIFAYIHVWRVFLITCTLISHTYTRSMCVCVCIEWWQTLSPRYLWHHPQCIISRHSFFAFIVSMCSNDIFLSFVLSLFILCWLCSAACVGCVSFCCAHFMQWPISTFRSHIHSIIHIHVRCIQQCTLLKMSNGAGAEMSTPHQERESIGYRNRRHSGENESTQQIMDVFCINIAECVCASVYGYVLKVPKCWGMWIIFCSISTSFLNYCASDEQAAERTGWRWRMVQSRSDVTKYIPLHTLCVGYHFAYSSSSSSPIPYFLLGMVVTLCPLSICQHPCWTSLKNVDKMTKQKRK